MKERTSGASGQFWQMACGVGVGSGRCAQVWHRTHKTMLCRLPLFAHALGWRQFPGRFNLATFEANKCCGNNLLWWFVTWHQPCKSVTSVWSKVLAICLVNVLTAFWLAWNDQKLWSLCYTHQHAKALNIDIHPSMTNKRNGLHSNKISPPKKNTCAEWPLQSHQPSQSSPNLKPFLGGAFFLATWTQLNAKECNMFPTCKRTCNLARIKTISRHPKHCICITGYVGGT